MMITLNKLKAGQKGKIVSLTGSGAVRRHLIDMGITPGAVVRMRKAAPLGDPIEIYIRGYVLSLRRSEAKEITVKTED